MKEENVKLQADLAQLQEGMKHKTVRMEEYKHESEVSVANLKRTIDEATKNIEMKVSEVFFGESVLCAKSKHEQNMNSQSNIPTILHLHTS